MSAGEHRTSWIHRPLLVLVLLVAVLFAVAAAQGETAETSPELAEETATEDPAAIVEERELQEQLAALEKRGEELRKAVRRARGDDLEVLVRQQADLRVQYLKTISALVQNLLRQEREELDAITLRRQVEKELRLLIPRITAFLDDAGRRVTNLRRKREEVPETELLAIEQAIGKEIEWGIVLYRGMADTVEDMELLGMDASKFRADLTQDVLEAAEAVAGRLSLEVEQQGQVQQRLAESPDDEGLKARLAAFEQRRKTTTESLSVAVRLLQRLDQPATKYQKLLITTTGEVTADVFDKDVALDLLNDAIDSAADWIEQNGPNYTFRFVLFIAIVFFSRLLGNLIRRIVTRALASDRVKTTQLLRNMAASLLGNAVFVAGILFGLSQMGIELGPILAGLGIVGFIVGFALQDVLGNFAAGVILLSIRPYDVGDMIEAAGVSGQVSHMSLVSTTILTIDHQTLVIPNGKIWGGVIKNITYQRTRRVDMSFRVSYADDVDHVEKVLAGILEDHDKVLKDPKPLLKLHKLDENAIEFIVRPWVNTADYWDTYWDVTREVKRRFDEEGITIPLAQREVRVISGSGGGTT